jgi:hypothetical protein
MEPSITLTTATASCKNKAPWMLPTTSTRVDFTTTGHLGDISMVADVAVL